MRESAPIALFDLRGVLSVRRLGSPREKRPAADEILGHDDGFASGPLFLNRRRGGFANYCCVPRTTSRIALFDATRPRRRPLIAAFPLPPSLGARNFGIAALKGAKLREVSVSFGEFGNFR